MLFEEDVLITIEHHQSETISREIEKLMAISSAFQAQLDRLTAYTAALGANVDAKDAEDTAALSDTLDTAGAPPAADPAPVPPEPAV